MKQNNKDILELVNQYRYKFGENLHDTLLESIYSNAAEITNKTVSFTDKDRVYDFDSRLDKIVTSKLWGFPIMILLLALVFWLTIQGANYPSQFLAYILVEELYPLIRSMFVFIGLPNWITGLLVDGGYLASAWIISVMLPPMAIFFPLFTLLEDYGYLPRVSFNLDNLFRKVGAHGKQALTMTMGFGCNAAGVVATRIIDSPRERLIAIITNNFSICNGRWPLQILVATLFIGGLVPGYLAGLISASAVVLVALLGIGFSLLVSLFLSKTVLKGEPSAFSLELPPYRPPRLLQTLYTSFIDRTLVVLWRAVIFAFPSGLVIWLISNVTVNSISISQYLINWLDPFGLLIGLNGIIILAYIIAIPANEVVIPTILMLTVLTLNITGVGSGAGVLFESDNIEVTFQILRDGGWTLLTGINIMIFSLLHNPCSTTIYTIYKETRSAKWTIIATFLPILMGVVVCLFIALLFRIV